MKYTRDELSRKAWQNIIVNITGESKSGKSHLAIRSDGHRYIVYLDRNTTLAYQLLSAEDDGFPYDELEVDILELPPIPYAELTVQEAENRVTAVWDFAKKAIQEAEDKRALGERGGTFIIDGALLLKGYMEKWRLGDSARLVYRDWETDRKSTRLNSSHEIPSRMPSSA